MSAAPPCYPLPEHALLLPGSSGLCRVFLQHRQVPGDESARGRREARAHHEAAGERAPTPLVGEPHRRVQEPCRVAARARQRDLLQHAAPVLRLRLRLRTQQTGVANHSLHLLFAADQSPVVRIFTCTGGQILAGALLLQGTKRLMRTGKRRGRLRKGRQQRSLRT